MEALRLVLLKFFLFSKFSPEWLIYQLRRKPESDMRFRISLSWYIIDKQQRNPQLLWRSAVTCAAGCNLYGCQSNRTGFIHAKAFSSMATHFAIRVIYLFDVFLTVHLSIFILLFNQLDAQNLFHKFYFMYCDFDFVIMSTCARNM